MVNQDPPGQVAVGLEGSVAVLAPVPAPPGRSSLVVHCGAAVEVQPVPGGHVVAVAVAVFLGGIFITRTARKNANNSCFCEKLFWENTKTYLISSLGTRLREE